MIHENEDLKKIANKRQKGEPLTPVETIMLKLYFKALDLAYPRSEFHKPNKKKERNGRKK